MDLPLNVDVHCADGRCGRSTYIILNPALEKVTHFVVSKRPPERSERVVPIEWIEKTTPELILLNRTLEQFSDLETFRQKEFIFADLPHYASDPKLTAVWPYAVPAKRVIDDNARRIPPGEMAVRRGAKVRSTDGRVGRVDLFIVDDNAQITHLRLRRKELWGERGVSVPVSNIAHIEEGVVHLNLSSEEVGNLPRFRLRRAWES